MKNIHHLDFFFELHSVGGRINKQVDRNLSTIHGVGLSELMVMRQLSFAPKQTLSRIELANSIGLSASGVTRLLNPMEKIGLVKKEANARDARVSLVKLSRAGKTIYQEALATCEDSVGSMINGIPEQSINTATELLGKLK